MAAINKIADQHELGKVKESNPAVFLGCGKDKISKVVKERDTHGFYRSASDFEDRLKGTIKPELILKNLSSFFSYEMPEASCKGKGKGKGEGGNPGARSRSRSRSRSEPRITGWWVKKPVGMRPSAIKEQFPMAIVDGQWTEASVNVQCSYFVPESKESRDLILSNQVHIKKFGVVIPYTAEHKFYIQSKYAHIVLNCTKLKDLIRYADGRWVSVLEVCGVKVEEKLLNIFSENDYHIVRDERGLLVWEQSHILKVGDFEDKAPYYSVHERIRAAGYSMYNAQ